MPCGADPLREVVVGLASGAAVPPLHPAEEAKVFHLPSTLGSVGPRAPEKIAAAAAELDNFCKILEAHGVTVRRPRVESNVGFSTPNFSTETANGWSWPVTRGRVRKGPAARSPQPAARSPQPAARSPQPSL